MKTIKYIRKMNKRSNKEIEVIKKTKKGVNK